MKRKLLIASSLVLSMSLITGVGTYAFFNAQTPTTNNNFLAGRISIEANRDSGDAKVGPLFYTTAADGVASDPNSGTLGIYADKYLKPGFESEIKTLVITNKGRILPKLTKLSAVADGDDTLAKVLRVTVRRANILGQPLVYQGTLKQLIDSPQELLTGPININGVDTDEVWQFVASFPEDQQDQNIYQGKSLKLDFVVHAEPQ